MATFTNQEKWLKLNWGRSLSPRGGKTQRRATGRRPACGSYRHRAKMVRQIDKSTLFGVRRLNKVPKLPLSKLSPKAREGILFESGLRRRFRAAGFNAESFWISFHDCNGPGLAKPDIVLQLSKTRLLVVEVKLSLHAEAAAKAAKQLKHLYIPLLETLYPKMEVVSLIVGKYASREGPRPLACVVESDLQREPFYVLSRSNSIPIIL